ncbi:MAG TPA: YceI family protein [Candidatus Dormibacteraeota bacterium]|nr:YceI family protein [Candidatus Dormibacteraeota bacterium]
MKWEIDPVHSTIGFSAKHLMVSTVRGRFGAVRGTIDLDPADPERARGEVVVDAASVDTNMPMRDQHLRSADFLDAEKFPHLVYRISGVRRLGPERYRVEGDLTIRGVTRPIALDAELSDVFLDTRGRARIAVSATGSLDRTEFGLRWNQTLETGAVLVGDRVKIELEVTAAQAAEAIAA